MSDMVNNPPHYTCHKIEPIDVIEDWKLCFHLGNAIKYIARAGHKDNRDEDLRKAVWYIQRLIENKAVPPSDESYVSYDEWCRLDDEQRIKKQHSEQYAKSIAKLR